jgi:hypothetical protein
MSATTLHPHDTMKAEIMEAAGDAQLLFDLQPKAYDLLLQDFKQKAVSHDPLKKLEEICKTYLAFGLANPETYKLMFIPIIDDNSAEVKLHGETDTRVYKYFMDCLETCIQRELIHFKRAEIGALQIWSMMHGLVSLNIQSRIGVIGIKSEFLSNTLNKTVEDFLKTIKR